MSCGCRSESRPQLAAQSGGVREAAATESGSPPWQPCGDCASGLAHVCLHKMGRKPLTAV